jgi:ubiquinone/menaquinone biosynthesis C-methylase UbiE
MNAEEYVKLAEVEDRMWYFRSVHAHVRRELLATLGSGRKRPENASPASGSGPVVLDAGCGTGGLMLRLSAAEPRWKLCGIDQNPLACELARRRCGPGTPIREGSVTAMPYDHRAFDAVVSVDVVCQVEEPARVVAEFFRVLRPGGVVVINVPAYRWMWSYHDEAVHTRKRYTRTEVAHLLRQAGFRLTRLTHWNALPFPLVWAKRKIFPRSGATSDVRDYPGVVDAVLLGMMAVEHAWLEAGGSWAWGTSILAVAHKSPE